MAGDMPKRTVFQTPPPAPVNEKEYLALRTRPSTQQRPIILTEINLNNSNSNDDMRKLLEEIKSLNDICLHSAGPSN